MILHFNDSQMEVAVTDESYRYQAVMGEHSLTLYFSLPEYVDIPVGAWCEFQGERYELFKPGTFTKHGPRNFEYTITFDSDSGKLEKYKLRNTVDRRLKFNYTAKPHEHIQLLVDNLNQRDSGWVVGECIEAVEKLVSYNHNNCKEALQSIADAFETEWEVDGKTIHLRKVEYNKDAPLSLSYGRGNGFKPGLGRSNYDNSKAIEILYVQGGERNIDASKYKSPELLLPKARLLDYEGRQYVSDADGYSIQRADKELRTFEEDSLDCSNIYPSRVGTVSKVIVVDESKNFYDFSDESIPMALNFEKCLIEGETMTVVFQSGMLSGRELEVKYKHDARRFEIVPQEIDGQTMPNATFKPAVGDKYAVFGISLPDAYVCNNADQSGASWDMFREAAKYLYENEDPKFSFTGEMDGIWAKRNWENIGGKIKLGGYVLFTDNQFQQEGILIRMVGIKDMVNNPHSPVIELSNVTTGGSFASELGKIEQNEVVTDILHKEAIQYTKRRLRDARETTKMLIDSKLENFSGATNPISVSTMQMIVGDESLQFRFVSNKTNPVQVACNIAYDDTAKVLTAPAALLQHMTLGITSLTAARKPEEYQFWQMEAFTSGRLDDARGYYLYAKVSKTAETGVFYLSPRAIKMEEEAGYYHLLVGILNSEYEGARSWVELYGFTEVLPGRVTTDRVVSSDGMNYLDFIANAFRVGGADTYLSYNAEGDGRLKLKGTIVQSHTGVDAPIGVYCGAYNLNLMYHVGDEVTYGGALYRCTKDHDQKWLVPTNAVYWQKVVDKGSNGDPGAQGAMLRPRGEWNASTVYVNDEQYHDCVIYKPAGSSEFFSYMVKTGVASVPAGTVPTDTAYWSEANSFEFIATKALTVDQAFINTLVAHRVNTQSPNSLVSVQIDPDQHALLMTNSTGKKVLVVEAKESDNAQMTFWGTPYKTYCTAGYLSISNAIASDKLQRAGLTPQGISFDMEDSPGSGYNTASYKYNGFSLPPASSSQIGANSILEFLSGCTIKTDTLKVTGLPQGRTTDAHIQALPSGAIFIDTGQNANNCCMLRTKL